MIEHLVEGIVHFFVQGFFVLSIRTRSALRLKLLLLLVTSTFGWHGDQE